MYLRSGYLTCTITSCCSFHDEHYEVHGSLLVMRVRTGNIFSIFSEGTGEVILQRFISTKTLFLWGSRFLIFNMFSPSTICISNDE